MQKWSLKWDRLFLINSVHTSNYQVALCITVSRIDIMCEYSAVDFVTDS